MMIELNEFDPEFLMAASGKLGLKNIPKLLGLSRGRTTTDDQVEHQGLDPWVQWVNVHTGTPLSVHGVKRLGDTRSQTQPQLWTQLAERGWRSGVWGVMNAPRGPTDKLDFFFPDPWSFDETAHPERLNALLDLPRYMSKNYLDFDRGQALAKAFRMIAGLSDPRSWAVTANFTSTFLGGSMRKAPSIHSFASYLDYLSARMFLDLRRKHRPHFSLIFLNIIAHLQHQFWPKGDEIHPEMKLGLQLTDRILGDLYADLQPGESFILLNGLKQKNVDGEGFHVYRQKDPARILKWLDVEFDRVEQCMTHDAQILFKTAEDADAAVRKLDACVLSDGVKAFFVERLSATRVFYQISFEHAVARDAEIRAGNASIPFGELIDLYATRTGAHIPEGDVFYSGVDIPDGIHNHEIARIVLDHFRQPAPEPKADVRVTAVS